MTYLTVSDLVVGDVIHLGTRYQNDDYIITAITGVWVYVQLPPPFTVPMNYTREAINGWLYKHAHTLTLWERDYL